MEALRNSDGFFGPSLLADISLVIQIVFFLTLCAGVVAQLQGKYKWHDRLQIPVVVLNLFFIFFIMVPTFRAVATSNGAQIPKLVTGVHAFLGTVAQLLAIYCLLAGLKILPRKIGILRYWMWAAFTAWMVTIVFGIAVYITFYTPLLAAPGSEVMGEHDADLGQSAPVDKTAEEQAAAVAEHDAEQSAAQPSEASATPVEEVVAEHDAVEAVVELPPTATIEAETEAAAGTTLDDGKDDMEALIDEHMGDVVEVIEPEFRGNLAQAVWIGIETTNEGPGPRYEHAMQHNVATNQVFVFGGRDGSQIFNDVWALDMDTFTWEQLAVNAPLTPPARYSTVMIVDQAGQNLYISTGHTQGGQNFSDVWRLDLTTEVWEDLTEAAGTGPEARYGSPGGNLGGNLLVTHGFGSTRYDDTWQFNIETQRWENITPSGAVPLRRCLFAATPADTSLVIHGGCASGFGDCFLDDTWVLDTTANAWREVFSDIKPVGRQYQTLVANANNANQIVLFGGQDATRAAREDLWILDLATGGWQLADASGGPRARYQHAAVWIPDRGMLLYGGRESGPLGDLWLLNVQGSSSAPAPTATPVPAVPTNTPEPPPPPPTAIPEPAATPELISEHDGG